MLIDAVKSAIQSFTSSLSEEALSSSEDLITNWMNSPECFSVSISLVQNETQASYIFFASLALQNLIEQHWDYFDNDKCEVVFSTLVSFITRSLHSIDHPHIMKLLVCLRDLILFDFSFFDRAVSSLIGDSQLLLLSLLFESFNYGDKFLHRWGIAQRVRYCLSLCAEHALCALECSRASSAWLRLHKSLRAFVGEFRFFYKYTASVKDAAASMQHVHDVFSVICDILECRTACLCDSDKNYYFFFVEVLVSVSFCLFSQGVNSDESYLYEINSWEILFDNVSFDFFEEVSQIPFLMNVLNQFFSNIQILVQPSEIFLGLLDSFSSFICSFPDDHNFKELFFSFFQLLSSLLETDNESFVSPTIFGVLSELQRTFPDFYSDFVESLHASSRLTPLLLFVSSSDRSLWPAFAARCVRLLLTRARSPVASLIFIRRVGVHFSTFSRQLISLSLHFASARPELAFEVLEQYSLTDASLLVPFVGDIVSLASRAPPSAVLSALSALYRAAPFDASIYPVLLSGISACVGAASCSCRLPSALELVTRVFESAPVGAPAAFKRAAFGGVLSRVQPFLHTRDARLQSALTNFFIICVSHGYVTDRAYVVRWLCSVLNIFVTNNTFVLCSYFIDLFPIEPILSFIYSFDYNSDNVIASKIIDFIHELFLRSPIFWSFMRKDFLCSLLCISNIVPVNSAFGLFFDIFRDRVDESFALTALESAFRCLPVTYQVLQTKSAARLAVMAVRAGSTTARGAADALSRAVPACGALAEAACRCCEACEFEALVGLLMEVRRRAGPHE